MVSCIRCRDRRRRRASAASSALSRVAGAADVGRRSRRFSVRSCAPSSGATSRPARRSAVDVVRRRRPRRRAPPRRAAGRATRPRGPPRRCRRASCARRARAASSRRPADPRCCRRSASRTGRPGRCPANPPTYRSLRDRRFAHGLQPAPLPRPMHGQARDMTLRPLVPPRSAPARPPGAARGGAGRPGRRAVRARPGAAASRPARRGSRSSTARCARSTRDLREHGGRLLVRRGDPVTVVPTVAREADAASVHVSADFGPYGVTPRRGGRAGARRRAARAHRVAVRGRPGPGAARATATRSRSTRRSTGPGSSTAGAHPRRRSPAASTGTPSSTASTSRTTRAADGARAARAPARTPRSQAWRAYRTSELDDYADDRDRPDLDRTSHMSVYLKWGCIHPRTLLADLGRRDETYRKELAWREFYAARAAPLARQSRASTSCRSSRRCPTRRPTTKAFDAWRDGRTGYPIVDAGMRQLLGAGLDAQPGAHDRRVVPRQGPAHRVAARRAALHAAPRRRRPRAATSTAGSGRPAPAPTRRRTTGSSTRSRRARSSTRTATTCAAGCPSCATSPARRCTSRGTLDAAAVRLPRPDRRPRDRAQGRARALPGDPLLGLDRRGCPSDAGPGAARVEHDQAVRRS